MIDIDEIKKIYDGIYKTVSNYNFHDEIKNSYVDAFAELVGGELLDAGCGEGVHLRRLLKNGYNVFGIEISEVCCSKFLMDLPHENTDILTYCNKGKIYDGLICMDVLEHVDPEQIEDTLHGLAKISKNSLFGIGNHSDILNGIELHLIREDLDWWISLLRKFYIKIHIVSELSYGTGKNIFFLVFCSNEKGFGERGHVLGRFKGRDQCFIEKHFSFVDKNIINNQFIQLDRCRSRAEESEKTNNLLLERIKVISNNYDIANSELKLYQEEILKYQTEISKNQEIFEKHKQETCLLLDEKTASEKKIKILKSEINNKTYECDLLKNDLEHLDNYKNKLLNSPACYAAEFIKLKYYKRKKI